MSQQIYKNFTTHLETRQPPRQNRRLAETRSQPRQLGLFKPPPEPEPRPRLEIERIPPSEGITPWRFRLVHHPSKLRLPGSFCHCEAEKFLEATLGWDWSIEEDREPACAWLVEPLINSILKSQKGGEQ